MRGTQKSAVIRVKNQRKSASKIRGNLRSRFFWNLYARCYDSIYHLMPYRKLLWDAYQALGLKPGMKVLDAGCGTGNFEKFAEEKDLPKITIEAIEPSTWRLKRAEKKCKNLDYVSLAETNLNERLNYSDNTFDRIVSLNLLPALKNPQFTLQEFRRVLKPQGKLVLATPKTDSFPIQTSILIRNHLRRVRNIWGISRKLFTLLETPPLLFSQKFASSLLHTFALEKNKNNEEFHFLPGRNFANLLEQNNFQEVSVKQSCAGQNWLTVGNKNFDGLSSSHAGVIKDATMAEASFLNKNYPFGRSLISTNGLSAVPVKVDKDQNLSYEKQGVLINLFKVFSMPLLNFIPSSVGKFIFTAFSNDTKKVRREVATHNALEVMYTFPSRRKNREVNVFDYFWENFLSNARSIRNRFKLVETQLQRAIQNVGQSQKEVKILSLGSGSARAIIETLTESKNLDGKNIRARLIDISRDALTYSKKLAEEYGVIDSVEWVRGNIQNLERHCEKFQPDIVEMVGILDYFSKDKAIELVSKVYRLLPAGGWLVTCNINENQEKPFVTKSIGWPMIYRSYEELSEIILEAGFPSENLSFLYEPLKIHGLCIARKNST